MKFKLQWKWFDLWIGAYWDINNHTLYICPLPTVVLRIEFLKPKDDNLFSDGLDENGRPE